MPGRLYVLAGYPADRISGKNQISGPSLMFVRQKEKIVENGNGNTSDDHCINDVHKLELQSSSISLLNNKTLQDVYQWLSYNAARYIQGLR